MPCLLSVDAVKSVDPSKPYFRAFARSPRIAHKNFVWTLTALRKPQADLAIAILCFFAWLNA